MKNKFLENLEHCEIKNKQTLVLGVSGGVDSVTMLDLFAESGLDLNLIIAHLDHGVRTEAVKDEKLVNKLAKKYGFRFVSAKITKPKTGNLEEELRKNRQNFLSKVARESGADYIALAHHVDDQAETVIFNLLRGAGPAGLGGMSMSEGIIIRPLLNFSREEIEKYAKDKNLKWNEDITNTDINFTRNYIRHEILPKFSKINPDWRSAIYRSSYIQRKVTKHFKEEVKNIKLTIETINKLDFPSKFELLSQNYEKLTGNRNNLSFVHLLAFEELLLSAEGTTKIDLPNEIEVVRKYSLLEFRLRKEDNIPLPEAEKITLGITLFGEWKIEAKKTTKFENAKDLLTIDEDDLNKVQIRTWQQGDRIEKKGLEGKKKLQDLFTDDKIDKESRKTWPIIVKDTEIIWIPGVAISRNIKKKNNNLVKITARKVVHE